MSDVAVATHLLSASGLGRTYTTGPTEVHAVQALDLQVDPGSFVVVRGRSGSGKTTLLNMLGGLDRPTTGTVLLDGEDVTAMDEATLSETRRTKVGFIFQAFGLIPILSATENVEVPMRLMKTSAGERRARSSRLLDQVGLADRAGHRPEELSGGEQQRVAIARALANSPRLLLADEPTGQLDSRTGRVIIDLIVDLVHSENIAAIVATHDPAPIAIADRVIELSDGHVVSDTGA
ncbi:MAG TPA: ABC transporter ATP-binding protein [Acidimicrobiia bacterium]|nr:ABC transporter ATP-binding protein [Acidimicrobiia bacterium]